MASFTSRLNPLLLILALCQVGACKKDSGGQTSVSVKESATRPTGGSEDIPGFGIESEVTVVDISTPTSVKALGASVSANGDTFTEPVKIKIQSLRDKENFSLPEGLIFLGQGVQITVQGTAEGQEIAVINQPMLVRLKAVVKDQKSLDETVVYGKTSISGETLFYENSALSFEFVDQGFSLAGEEREVLISFHTSVPNAQFIAATADGGMVTQGLERLSRIYKNAKEVFSLSAQINYVASPTKKYSKAGDEILVDISFTKEVLVTGAPLLYLDTGSIGYQTATYLEGSETSALRFRYVVKEGDNTKALDYANRIAIDLNGGTIKSAEQLEAILTLPVAGGAKSLSVEGLTLDTERPLFQWVPTHPASYAWLTQTPVISWKRTASDDGGSGIDFYEYAIGTGITGTTLSDVVDWTTVESETFQHLGLALVNQTVYYVSIRALDNAQNPSLPMTSVGYTANKAPLLVEALYKSNGSSWNDYVKADGDDHYQASDTACGLSGSTYHECVHGGEKKKVMIEDVPTCDDLTLKDQLEVFSWFCDDTSGTATFYSYGFKAQKGMVDLLDENGWRANKVTLTGKIQNESISSPWWTNPVEPFPDKTESVWTLNATDDDGAGPDKAYQPGTVFILGESRISPQYKSSLDKVSFVTLRGAAGERLYLDPRYYSTDNGGIIAKGDFNWIEVEVKCVSISSPNGIYVSGQNHRIHNSSVLQCFQSIKNSSTVKGLAITHSKFVGAATPFMDGIDNALYFGNHIFNHSAFDGDSSPASNQRFVKNALTHFDQFGRQMSMATGNDTWAFNLIAMGTLLSLNDHSTLHQNLVQAADLMVVSTCAFTSSVFIPLGSKLQDSRIDGVIVSSDWNGSCNANCTNMIDDGATTIDDVDFSDSFVGPVYSGPNLYAQGQTVLPDNDANQASFDMTNFASPQQFWFRVGSFIPGFSSKEISNGGPIQIYDWRLKKTDTVLLNKSGDGTDLNTPFIDGEICPTAVHGNEALVSTQSDADTFLKNAMEAMLDGYGDEDGLCETGEHCIYAPNIGYYQGEGDYRSRSCKFENGTVSGVTMYAYPVNGI